MKSLIALPVFLLLVSACWSGTAAPDRVFEARAVAVLDGDSLIVKSGRIEFEIRLYGIDAPEKNQPWSDRSRKTLQKLIEGKLARVEPVETDRYQRTVARVYRASDGLYINAEMIGTGNAWVYRRYTDERQLIRREKEARRDSTGLWQQPAPQAPWEWRKEHETS